MTKSKRFVMKDPNDWGYPITDTDTGKVYSCASNIWMKELCTDINKIVDENEQLKNEVFDWKASAEDYLKLGKSLKKENEQLKKELSDIDGQLLMLDNCDNWDYDRMKHTVREIAEIIGYNGTINPKRR